MDDEDGWWWRAGAAIKERERERGRESPGPSGVVRCLFVPAGERKERESYTSFVVREDDRSLLA